MLPTDVSDSNAALTAPVEVTVVTAVQSAEPAVPNRTSLPSRFAPATPAACCAAVPCISPRYTTIVETANSANIAPKMVQPWRRLPTMRPYVYVSDAGMQMIASISTKFESPLPFSNGIAELTLKKPPPLVPSSLMISCEATGPQPPRSCTTPCDTRTTEPTIEIGSST